MACVRKESTEAEEGEAQELLLVLALVRDS